MLAARGNLKFVWNYLAEPRVRHIAAAVPVKSELSAEPVGADAGRGSVSRATGPGPFSPNPEPWNLVERNGSRLLQLRWRTSFENAD